MFPLSPDEVSKLYLSFPLTIAGVYDWYVVRAYYMLFRKL